jgi:hypothetical protein
MNRAASELLAELSRLKVSVTADGGDLVLRGPRGALTDGLRDELRAAKPQLLELLRGEARIAADGIVEKGAPTGGDGPRGVVTVGGRDHPYRRWAGERLAPADGYLAFDTETEVVDLRRQIPRLALASASAGAQVNRLIHPDDVGAFLLAHRGLRFVGHNVGFDFWVVEDHLRRRGAEEARRAWWAVAEDGRLHDSMLLDMLLRLARDDSFPEPRNLAVVALQYGGLEVDKDDPYRLRYGETLGRDWAEVEEGFFRYAVKDALVTRPAYLALREQALALAEESGRRCGDVLPDAAERFGLLTEAVQVKKSIALAQVTRNGMAVDLTRVRQGEADLRRRLDGAVARVRGICPGLFKTDKQGDLCRTKAGAPSRSHAALDGQLAAVAEEIRQATGAAPKVPLTPRSNKPTRSTKVWAEYAQLHPFLAAWVEAEELARLLQFFGHLQEPRVHPDYKALVRSGRTAASDPNVQQVPREGPLRQAFTASPGHFLLASDYSFIELRTLAAVCLRRYGRSALADVIKAGADPHAHTAALMRGVPAEEFLRWKDDPGRADAYASARQAANFGVPGGLGAAALASYAKQTYGVPLTPDEARQRRELLITSVYPELSAYLAEDAPVLLAENLRAPAEEVARVMSDVPLTCVRKILEGDPKRRDGAPYCEGYVQKVWADLARVNRDPDIQEALEDRVPSKGLARRVCQSAVATLTGRIRGRVRYSQARNTPFQGLAADGAALALFALVREGFRVVGFVHDEVLVELADEGGFVSEAVVRRVEEVLRREMAGVLSGGVPVGVESALATRWHKKAKLVVREGRVYPWSPPGDDLPPPPAAEPPPPPPTAGDVPAGRAPGCGAGPS